MLPPPSLPLPTLSFSNLLLREHFDRATKQLFQPQQPPPAAATATMTCGKLQVQSRGLLWLLSTVYLVQIATVNVRRSAAVFQLIVQRPRFAGGFLAIPLDTSVKLVRCSKRALARHTIRLQYGPSGKRISFRAANVAEREMWITAIQAGIGNGVRPADAISHPNKRTKLLSQSKSNPTTAQGERHAISRCSMSVMTTAMADLDSIAQMKQLADRHNDLAKMWDQFIMEQREYTAYISSLRPSNVKRELDGPVTV